MVTISTTGSGGRTPAATKRAASKYPFAVGNPGPGQTAPPIRLPSMDGGTFDLAAQPGKTVLLYFQEGLMCQPCWDSSRISKHRRAK